MGAQTGHAVSPSFSILHACSQDMVTSALSIKLDNKQLSKISTGRKPNPRFHPLLQYVRKAGEGSPGLHLCPSLGAEAPAALLSGTRNPSDGTAPRGSQRVCEHDMS